MSKTRNTIFTLSLLLLLFLSLLLLFCFTVQQKKTRCIQRLERNKLKKLLIHTNLAPFAGSLVHSKDPDQKQQSVESDHGLH